MGDIAKVRLVAITAGELEPLRAFVDASWLIITDIIWTRAHSDRVIAGKRTWILRPTADGRPGHAKSVDTRNSSDLQQPGVGGGELVFGHRRSLRPVRGVIL